MAYDPNTGRLRELLQGEEPKKDEVLFITNEVVTIKGCDFEIVNVYPNPQNFLMLKGVAKQR